MSEVMERKIIKACCKKEHFSIQDIIVFKKGKIHIHRFVPHDIDELTSKFEAKCNKCGYIRSHNW